MALFLGGCEEVIQPVPTQQAPVVHRARVRLEMALDAPVPGGAAIQSGVDQPAPNVDWRWMSSDAVFGFDLEDRPDWRLELQVTAVDKVLREVGPQELVVRVNGTEAGRVALNKPGPLHLAYVVHAGPKTTVELQT
ncbi:MAG TPA: hypothetical protein VNH18_04760, partial [Bryobacteraceae bacterium]|nr:hypothetical protein [Bryobacteraceae bacterium]